MSQFNFSSSITALGYASNSLYQAPAIQPPLFATNFPTFCDDDLRCPVEKLPPAFKAVVTELIEKCKVSPEVVMAATLGVGSLVCLKNLYVLAPYGVEHPVTLNLEVLADSGERKSAALEAVMAPVHEVQQEFSEQYDRDMKTYNADKELHDIGKKALSRSVARNIQNGKEADNVELTIKFSEHTKNAPKPPQEVKLFYNNATLSGVVYGLSKFPIGGYITAEYPQILAKNASSSFSELNQRWDGEPLCIDRADKSVNIPVVRLTCVFIYQPKAEEFYHKKHGVLAQGTGYQARFLFAQAAPRQGSRTLSEASVVYEHLPKFNERIKYLMRKSITAELNGDTNKIVLTLSDEAKAMFVQCYNNIEFQAQLGGVATGIKEFNSKLPQHILRLAAVFQYVTDDSGATISAQNMSAAICFGYWYANHHIRKFSPKPEVPQVQKDADALAAFLAERALEGQTQLKKTWVQQRGPIRNQIARLNETLNLLVIQKRIWISYTTHPQQPSRRTIWINFIC